MIFTPPGVLGQQNAGARLAAANGIIFYYAFPTGQAGPYAPKLSDAQIAPLGSVADMVLGNGSTTSDHGATLDDDGYLKIGTPNRLFRVRGIPAKTTSARLYKIVFKSTQDPAVELDSWVFRFNMLDSNNRFDLRFNWEFGLWEGDLDIVIAGINTSLVDIVLPDVVDFPGNFIYNILDLGDRVNIWLSGIESDVLSDIATTQITYNEVDRRLKDETTFDFGSWPSVDFAWRSIMVMDI